MGCSVRPPRDLERACAWGVEVSMEPCGTVEAYRLEIGATGTESKNVAVEVWWRSGLRRR